MPPHWVRVHGRDFWLQEARLAVCKAAADWDPVAFPGVPFGAFVRRGVRLHLRGVMGRQAVKYPVWRAMPELDPETGAAPEPADHRPPGVHPALRAWCSEEYRAQRRCLDWRRRVLLYLRHVEGWTLEEVGGALAASKERVRQLEDSAVRKLAVYRARAARRDAV